MEDEILEEEVDLSTTDTNEDSDSDESPNGETKGRSNFKKLATSLKTTKKENEELKARLSSVENYLLENSDHTYKPQDNEETSLRLFVVETPEAKEYKDEIKQALLDYPGISLDKAFLLAKATKPQPSKTKTDFDFRTSAKPKNINSLSDEEAVDKLSPTEYLKYARETGAVKFS